jgi:16S rRNA (guanine1207-N2)-methyltransferase
VRQKTAARPQESHRGQDPASTGEYRLSVAQREFRFLTQPGVFSDNAADDGTLLLLDSVIPEVKSHARVLDLGTGVGIIGTVLSTLVPRGEVWMVDVDIRAARLAERNLNHNAVENAHVVLGDITVDLPKSLRFDVVVSNPPTHDGKEVLQRFVDESYRILRPGGRMWVVVNRLFSIQSMMAATFGMVETVSRKRGFVVLMSQKPRRSAGRLAETTDV